MGRCKPLGLSNSFLHVNLSYLEPTLFACSPKGVADACFLRSPISSAITMRGAGICWITVLGDLIHIRRPEITDGCDISYLLLWQEIFSRTSLYKFSNLHKNKHIYLVSKSNPYNVVYLKQFNSIYVPSIYCSPFKKYSYLLNNCFNVCISHSCPTLCDPMDCSLPGSSINGILQARTLEWVAILFSRCSS